MMYNSSPTEQIESIQERNKRVEADKAWETSRTRKLIIAIATYIIAVVVTYLLGVERYLLNALIPVIGYLLSTLSLGAVKSYWVKRYYKDEKI